MPWTTCRQAAQSNAGHEPDPRDLEIYELKLQVEQFNQCLESMARLNYPNDFCDGSDSDDFVNPFHNRSPVRRHRNMECYEDNGQI